MRRVKRRTSALQGLAVAAICILFVATALVGLYKCFSKEPEPRREQSQSSPDGGSAQEPEDGGAVQPVSARARKERFHTILIGGLDDENGGSDRSEERRVGKEC